ncbi:hypothetical protein [Primorskyibacter flagellatus]|uniref:hypothetical protein n=1 Tax=Primorskyibacter flagellatus TaxID=1387277 RepID=UPI0015C4D4D5|nr:hypothetical protein [Primorskyibacter flagellatus]
MLLMLENVGNPDIEEAIMFPDIGLEVLHAELPCLLAGSPLHLARGNLRKRSKL